MRLNEEKAARLRAAAAAQAAKDWFAEQVAAGYEVPGAGFRLGLEQSDVTLLTGAFVLAREAAAMGLGVPPIIDADGVPRQLTVEELTAVMLGYGQYRASLSQEYAARVAAAA